MDRATKQRTPSQRQRILTLLRESGESGTTNAELIKIAFKYGSRIQELYELGYEISTETYENGITTYKLISEPEFENKSNQAAIDILLQQVNSLYQGNVNANDLINLLDKLNFTVKRRINSHKKSVNKTVQYN